MKKIPLEATIIGAYKFLFQNIVSIIGTIWFPVLVSLAVIAALVAGIVPSSWLHGNFAPIADPDGYVRAHLALILLAVPILSIVSLLVGAMIRVGILRHALGEATTTTWIWFSLGARVWRMIGVALLAIAVSIVLTLAVVLVVGLVSLLLAAIPHVPAVVVGLVRAVVVIAGIVYGIYVMLRLFYFLPAIVVAENKIGVGRSWALGKGNVWRMIVVMIAVVLPVVIIGEIVIYATIFSTVISVMLPGQEPQGPAEVLALLKSLLPVIPVLLGVYLLMIVSVVGLSLGAVGKAYRAVTADEAA